MLGAIFRFPSMAGGLADEEIRKIDKRKKDTKYVLYNGGYHSDCTVFWGKWPNRLLS